MDYRCLLGKTLSVPGEIRFGHEKERSTIPATPWVNLENVMLIAGSQTQKDNYSGIPRIQTVQHGRIWETENRPSRAKEHAVSFRGDGQALELGGGGGGPAPRALSTTVLCAVKWVKWHVL